MKNFKKIYYIVYLLFTGFLFYIAYDLVNVLEVLRKWGWYSYFSELPTIGSRFIYFVMFFMLFELIYENYNFLVERRKRNNLEKELTELKAKLYDHEHAPVPEKSLEAPEEIPQKEEVDGEEDPII